MKRITILNQKGGVGKTSTTLNLGYGLAYVGKKVLLIDLDPQGHVALGLGLDKGENVYQLFINDVSTKDLILPARDEVQLHLIPGGRKTADADRELINKPFREKILGKKLKEVESDYDYIIIDCSPSFNLLNQNALLYADEVLVPMSMDYFATAGILDIETSLKELELDLDIIKGVIPTFFDVRTNKTHLMKNYLTEKFGDKVTPEIKINTKISEAQTLGKTIFEYDPSSTGAKNYSELVKWVLENE